MAARRVEQEAIAGLSAHAPRSDSMVEFPRFEPEFGPLVPAKTQAVPRGRSLRKWETGGAM
jgi:hypothetical protein